MTTTADVRTWTIDDPTQICDPMTLRSGDDTRQATLRHVCAALGFESAALVRQCEEFERARGILWMQEEPVRCHLTLDRFLQLTGTTARRVQTLFTDAVFVGAAEGPFVLDARRTQVRAEQA